jgi:hypothetical protein
LVATPTSPIPAARASGAIVRDGIAGLTGFNAIADTANSENVIIEKMIFFIVVINF